MPDDKEINLSEENFFRICRCCLKNCTIASIFQLMYGTISYVEIFHNLFGTPVNPNDELPTNLCEKCIGEIVHFYIFKKTCDDSIATLSKIIQARKNISVIKSEIRHEHSYTKNIRNEEIPQVKEESKIGNIKTENSEDLVKQENIYNKPVLSKIVQTRKNGRVEKWEIWNEHSYTNIRNEEIPLVEEEVENTVKDNTEDLNRRENIDNKLNVDQTVSNSDSLSGIVNNESVLLNMHLPLPKSESVDNNGKAKIPHIYFCKTCNAWFSRIHKTHFKLQSSELGILRNSHHQNNSENKNGDDPPKEINQTALLNEYLQSFQPQLKSDNPKKIKRYKFKLPSFCKICNKWFALGLSHSCKYTSSLRKSRYRLNANTENKGMKLDKSYMCSCNEFFSSLSEFLQHKKKENHTNPKTRTCSVCNKTLNYRSYDIHMITMHSDNAPFTADKKLDPKPERRRTSNKIYMCSCNEVFPILSEFLQHKKKENHTNPTTRTCHLCNKTLRYKSYDFHMSTVHSDDAPFSDDKKSYLNPESRRTSNKTYMCSCNEVFPTLSEFLRHKRKENHPNPTTRTCNVCNKTLSYKSYDTHMFTAHSDNRPFTCEFCGASFKLKQNMVKHIMRHTGEKRFMCDVCGKGFIEKHSLLDHRRLHTGEKPYLCSYCGEQFTRKTDYYNHLTVKHQEKSVASPENGDFQCTICDKYYTTKAVLRFHMHSSHGERKFLCTHCGNRFASRIALNKHLIRHTGERRFSCSFCDKKFVFPEDVKKHKFIHTGYKPYVCKFCSKAFRQGGHLTRHLRTHTGERPFKCPYCDKTFACYENRIVHIRLHTGERPYVCDVCSKGFCHSTTMKKHRRRHFKESGLVL